MPAESYAKKKNLEILEQIGKGWTSFVFLAKKKNGSKVVIKALREKANRRDMVKRESENLRLANSAGVGPRLLDADFFEQVVCYDYCEGIPFCDWIFSGVEKKNLEKFLKEIFLQARSLDEIGLDHGQLAGKGKNILVKKNSLPVIIDFEKASSKRRVGNVNQLMDFFFLNPNSSVVKEVKRILGDGLFGRMLEESGKK